MPASLPLSPSAERNKEPILGVLRGLVPSHGRVLEIASGTGQHVRHFAAALPGLDWQPSEATPAGLATLAAHLEDCTLANVRAPILLDVEQAAWPRMDPVDLVVCINMIHIAPYSATPALLAGASRVLKPSGQLVLYGPYREDGRHTAPSNEEFDAWLRARDPAWGVRDLGEVTALAAEAGFVRTRVERMPANNLVVGFARSAG